MASCTVHLCTLQIPQLTVRIVYLKSLTSFKVVKRRRGGINVSYITIYLPLLLYFLPLLKILVASWSFLLKNFFSAFLSCRYFGSFSLSFCSTEMSSSSIFEAYFGRIQNSGIIFFSTLNSHSLHYLVTFPVSYENSSFIRIICSLDVFCHFAFLLLFSLSVFILLGVFSDLGLCKLISFTYLGKFLAIISLGYFLSCSLSFPL